MKRPKRFWNVMVDMGEEAYDPIEKKWKISFLAGELDGPCTLGEVLPNGFSLDQNLGLTGEPGDTYLDLKDRIITTQKYNVQTENIELAAGTENANFLVLQMSLERGDEVVMGRPTWYQWEWLCRGLGAKVKIVDLKEELDWKWDFEELKEAVTRKTKVICLCNPNNPTGSVYNQEEVKTICDIAEEVNARLLSDECYRGFEWEKPAMSTPPAVNFYENAVSTASVTKTLSCDGLRVGWIATQNQEILKECIELYFYNIEHVNTLGIIAAWGALEPKRFATLLNKHRKVGMTNRQIVIDWMKKQTFFKSWVSPENGFLSFPGYEHELSSWDFCRRLLKEKKVFTMPGIDYDVEKHIRLGFGRTTPEDLRSALSKLEEFLKKLEQN